MWFPLESYDPTSAPQTGDVLSDRFQQALPGCVGLWLPSIDDRGKALDFNPTPSKNLGTLNGGITTTPGGFGVLGQSWNLNGTSGYISEIPVGGQSGPFTVFGFVYPTAHNTSQQIFSRAINGVTFDQNWLLFERTSNAPVNSWGFQVRSSNTDNSINSAAGSVILNQWAFVCGVYVNGSNLKLYVNGQLVASGGNSIPASTNGNTAIGAYDALNPTGFFAGNIGIVGSFSKALTAAQVSSLYQSLLTGEPFPLFQPQTTEMFAGAAAAVTSKIPWPLFFGRAA